jgi:hypothetical protein
VEDRKKMLLVQSQNPENLIALLFQRNSKLTKAKKSLSYVEWAIKHRFPVAVGEVIPEEWLTSRLGTIKTIAEHEPKRWLDERTAAKTRILR